MWGTVGLPWTALAALGRRPVDRHPAAFVHPVQMETFALRAAVVARCVVELEALLGVLMRAPEVQPGDDLDEPGAEQDGPDVGQDEPLFKLVRGSEPQGKPVQCWFPFLTAPPAPSR